MFSFSVIRILCHVYDKYSSSMTTVHHPWHKTGWFHFFVTDSHSREKKAMLRKVMHHVLSFIAAFNRFWIVLICKHLKWYQVPHRIFWNYYKRIPPPKFCNFEQLQKFKSNKFSDYAIRAFFRRKISFWFLHTLGWFLNISLIWD